MVSVLQLLNSNECATEVMEILFLFRKLILSQSDTKKKQKNPKKTKTVPVKFVICRSILQHNCCSMLFFFSKCKSRWDE